MTKKDYELIARIFHKNITDNDPRVSQQLWTAQQIATATAKQFADVLKSTNPKFDRERFLQACGVEA